MKRQRSSHDFVSSKRQRHVYERKAPINFLKRGIAELDGIPVQGREKMQKTEHSSPHRDCLNSMILVVQGLKKIHDLAMSVRPIYMLNEMRAEIDKQMRIVFVNATKLGLDDCKAFVHKSNMQNVFDWWWMDSRPSFRHLDARARFYGSVRYDSFFTRLMGLTKKETRKRGLGSTRSRRKRGRSQSRRRSRKRSQKRRRSRSRRRSKRRRSRRRKRK